MAATIRIDFVSDISCPFCFIALHSLEAAIAGLGSAFDVSIRFQPFELNPQMSREGEGLVAFSGKKYGWSATQTMERIAMVRARAEAVGLRIDYSQNTRVYNTFDAHRLLHWAHLEGKQASLKRALFAAYFQQARDPSDHGVLVDLAESGGLDPQVASEVLESGQFTSEVRQAENHWQSRGIRSVPGIVADDRHLLPGGQTPESYERMLASLA